MKKISKYTICSILFSILFLSRADDSQAQSPPLLRFSDLVHAAKSGLGDGRGQGAIVTVWGQFLGSSQGNSKVYVRDSLGTAREAAYIYNWKNATQHAGHPADLYTYHKMQYVQFSVPSASADGPGSIYVTVDGVDSNELPLTIKSAGSFRFVGNGCGAGQGMSADSGNGSYVDPWLTVQYAIGGNSAMTPGDVLYVCDGYSGHDEWGNAIGWNNYVASNSTDRTAILAYPDAVVAVESDNPQGRMTGIGNWGGGSYVTVSRFTIRSESIAVDTGTGALGYWRIIANEVTDLICSDGQAGAFVTGADRDKPESGTNSLNIYGNYIHDWGCSKSSNLQHTTYFSLRNGQSTSIAHDVGWNYLKDNQARDSFHIYDEHQCQGYSGIFKIHDNVIVNQVGAGHDAGADCDSGRSLPLVSFFYNNLFISSGMDQEDGEMGTSTVSLWGLPSQPTLAGIDGSGRFYNNTFYGYNHLGVISAQSLYRPLATPITNFLWHWKNNVIVDTQNVDFYYSPNFTNPTTTGYNLWYSVPAPSKTVPPWDSNALNGDPLLADPVIGGDFSPQSGSLIISYGQNFYAGDGDTDYAIKHDLLGNPRPANGGFTLGAFEYSSVTDAIPPAAPQGLSVI